MDAFKFFYFNFSLVFDISFKFKLVIVVSGVNELTSLARIVGCEPISDYNTLSSLCFGLYMTSRHIDSKLTKKCGILQKMCGFN